MIDQIGIALTGATAVFLSQSANERARRYACLFGMVGQPFWFWAAWSAQQWGVLAVTVLYTAAWGKGVWTHWLKPVPAPMTKGAAQQYLNDVATQRMDAVKQRLWPHRNEWDDGE